MKWNATCPQKLNTKCVLKEKINLCLIVSRVENMQHFRSIASQSHTLFYAINIARSLTHKASNSFCIPEQVKLTRRGMEQNGEERMKMKKIGKEGRYLVTHQ